MSEDVPRYYLNDQTDLFVLRHCTYLMMGPSLINRELHQSKTYLSLCSRANSFSLRKMSSDDAISTREAYRYCHYLLPMFLLQPVSNFHLLLCTIAVPNSLSDAMLYMSTLCNPNFFCFTKILIWAVISSLAFAFFIGWKAVVPTPS